MNYDQLAEELSPDEALAQIVAAYGFAGQSVAVAHYSFNDPNSMIAAYDQTGIVAPLVTVGNLPMSGSDLLDVVASIDENGPRLIANYRREFPELMIQIEAFDPEVGISETSAPGWIFALVSLVLGMSESDVAQALTTSHEAIEIDTFIEDDEGRYYLDTRRIIRSVMSYHIAGVDKGVIARSVFIALGGFVSDALRRLLKEWNARAILCIGDLFTYNQILRNQTKGSLSWSAVPVFFPSLEDPNHTLESSEELLQVRLRADIRGVEAL
ncbi:MAG: hypothetical protein HKL81_01610 [Acidimicrobiaceae bacterium]|nr:hypothetical protein [Acidimicrobiaceae bacterium]